MQLLRMHVYTHEEHPQPISAQGSPPGCGSAARVIPCHGAHLLLLWAHVMQPHGGSGTEPGRNKGAVPLCSQAVVWRVLSITTQKHMHILPRAHLLTKANTLAVTESATNASAYGTDTAASKDEQEENKATIKVHK